MISHRLFFVVVLSTLFLTVALLLIGGLEPAHAQCEAGSECEETILPTATPLRTDCPPGSHPVGIRDCEMNDTGDLPGPLLSSAGGSISAQSDFDFQGALLTINGKFPESSEGTFNRRVAIPPLEICGGPSILGTGVPFHVYTIVNTTQLAHTVDVKLTGFGGLWPVVYIYNNSFDKNNPALNCLKADDGDDTTPALIRRFTWRSGDQLAIVASAFHTGVDEGDYTLTITPVGIEQEPNDAPGQARVISPNIDRVIAEINPINDIDYYRFEAVSDQRVWIYVRTDQSTDSQDSFVELRNGSDVLVNSDASDDNNGGQSADSSSIAGFKIPDTGTYLVRVTAALSTATITPYYLYVYLSDQDPVAEDEPNNFTFHATSYDDDGGSTYQLPPIIFQGHQNNTVDGIDFFRFNIPVQFQLPLRSVIFTALDTNPLDNADEFTGTLSLYDLEETQVVSVASGDTSPYSEALSYGQILTKTLTTTTWYLSVFSNTNVAGPNLPYHLLAGYSPTKQGDITYSTDTNKFIFPDGGTITSTIVSGHYCMDNLDVWLDLDHDNLDDLDISLQAPDGTTIELFTDRGGDDNSLSITLDDEGGLAPLPDQGVDANNLRIGGRYQSENSTLSNFYQRSGIGQWLLTIVDDTGGNNLEPGNPDKLNNWALIMHCGLEQVYLPIVLKNNLKY